MRGPTTKLGRKNLGVLKIIGYNQTNVQTPKQSTFIKDASFFRYHLPL